MPVRSWLGRTGFKLGLIFRTEIETGTSLQKIAEQKLKPWARVNQPP